MGKTSIDSAREVYDRLLDLPDDSEYELQKKNFLGCKEWHLRQLKVSIMLGETKDAIAAMLDCIEAIIQGNAIEQKSAFFKFADAAMDWKAEQLAKKETGFEP